MMIKTRIKSIAITFLSALSLSFLAIPVARADTKTEILLTLIAKYTYAILQSVQQLPAMLAPVSQMALSMLTPDDSSPTADLQTNLSQYTQISQSNADTQLSLQPQLLNTLFGSTPPTNANSLSYTTLLNQPYSSTPETDANKAKVNSAFNYVTNAAGLAIPHYAPSKQWRGSSKAQAKYTGFYSTISSIESFNAYVLSELYSEYSSGLKLTALQKQLKSSASQSTWFATVASENIGIVFRQTLMYISQVYILLIQLVETQQQQLMAQTMTNTLLIVNTQTIEQNLLGQALGTLPTAGGI